MIQDEGQKVFVELKRVRELREDLPNAIDELQEDRRPVIVVVFVFAMTDAVCEFVAETEPFFLQKDLKANQGAIKGVE